LCSPSQSLKYASAPMQQRSETRVAGASGTALDVRSFGSLSRAIIEIRGLSDWSDERVITKDKPQKGSPKGGVPKKIPNAGQDSRGKKNKYKSRKGEGRKELGEGQEKEIRKILKITKTLGTIVNFPVPLPSSLPPLFATELEKLGKVSTVAVGTLGVCKAAGDESGGPLWRTTPMDHLDTLLDEFCNNPKVFGNNLGAIESHRQIISRTIAAKSKETRSCRAKLLRARQLTAEARSHRQTNHGASSRSPDTRLHACWYAVRPQLPFPKEKNPRISLKLTETKDIISRSPTTCHRVCSLGEKLQRYIRGVYARPRNNRRSTKPRVRVFFAGKEVARKRSRGNRMRRTGKKEDEEKAENKEEDEGDLREEED
ncbi:hypothetical protein ALC57_13958, partial [Trachymyrmex cornetzi]